MTRQASTCSPNFCRAVKPEVVLLADLRVIVEEADRAETQQPEQRDPDVRIAQVRPQQRRNHDRNDDQDAAHRRRAGLLLMRLRPVFADVLPDLELAQLANQPGPEDDAKEQSRQARKRRPERDVAEQAKRAKIGYSFA